MPISKAQRFMCFSQVWHALKSNKSVQLMLDWYFRVGKALRLGRDLSSFTYDGVRVASRRLLNLDVRAFIEPPKDLVE